MSSSPNQQHITQQSPPLSVHNDPLPKVVVPLPVIHQQEEIYYYVFVKGSLYAWYVNFYYYTSTKKTNNFF